MNLTIYQVDAFADKVFTGNPAAVVPLNEWLPTETMQNIALENNLSETAFFVQYDNKFHIRWFTPGAEVDLCGHATLAAAHVLFEHLNTPYKELHFDSRSGLLKVFNEGDQIVLDFPVSEISSVEEVPLTLTEAFNIVPGACFKGRDDYMLVFNTEKEIQELKPNYQKLIYGNTRGIIVTAPSTEYDFVSRFFAPAVGINEDPVTGSAHTMLIPYWAKRLNKNSLVAKQISQRGGTLYCKQEENRVKIGGTAITYLTGNITIE